MRMDGLRSFERIENCDAEAFAIAAGKSVSSGTCSGAGAQVFVGRDGESTRSKGCGEEPDTWAAKLSGEWGALDSSAMDLEPWAALGLLAGNRAQA